MKQESQPFRKFDNQTSNFSPLNEADSKETKEKSSSNSFCWMSFVSLKEKMTRALKNENYHSFFFFFFYIPELIAIFYYIAHSTHKVGAICLLSSVKNLYLVQFSIHFHSVLVLFSLNFSTEIILIIMITNIRRQTINNCRATTEKESLSSVHSFPLI